MNIPLPIARHIPTILNVVLLLSPISSPWPLPALELADMLAVGDAVDDMACYVAPLC